MGGNQSNFAVTYYHSCYPLLLTATYSQYVYKNFFSNKSKVLFFYISHELMGGGEREISIYIKIFIKYIGMIALICFAHSIGITAVGMYNF